LPLLAWANVGTTLIVFVAVLDLHLIVLYLLGISAIAFSFGKESHWRFFYGVLLGIGMLFYSIDLMKSSAAELQQYTWFRAVLDQSRGSYALAFLSGALLSFLTQSTTAVALLSVTMAQTGLLQSGDAVMVVYGGNVGSTFARMILVSGLRGEARQIARFQDLFKIVGTAAFVLAFYLETYAGVPLVQALAGTLAPRLEGQLAVINLLLNLLTALAFTACLAPLHRLLVRCWPADASEDLARAKYLHPQCLEDAESAMDLLEKEQARLLAQIPGFLNALRPAGPGQRPPDVHGLHQAFGLLAREIDSYGTALFTHSLTPEASERLINIQGRLELIRNVEDGTFQLLGTVQQAPPSALLTPLIGNVVEALEFLFLTARDAARNLDPTEARLLASMCADRGELMGQIRAQFLSHEQALSGGEKALLLSLTALFERIVWIVRRLALLLEQDRRLKE
jgi:phosphate:Na+ symporter